MGEFFAVLIIGGFGYLEYRRRAAKARARAQSEPLSLAEQKKNYLYIGLMLAVSCAGGLLVSDGTAMEVFELVAGLVGGLALIYKSSTIKVDATDGENALGLRIGIADEVAKYAALRDQGILTDDEFEHQKSKLLSSAELGGSANRVSSVTGPAYEQEPQAASAAAGQTPLPSMDDAGLMDLYGITYDGECYAYEHGRYPRLDDAVDYARLQAERERKA